MAGPSLPIPPGSAPRAAGEPAGVLGAPSEAAAWSASERRRQPRPGSTAARKGRPRRPVLGLRALALAVAAVLIAGPALAELRVAPPFGDGMVIQRGARVPVRGVTAPRAKVTVALTGPVSLGVWTARAGADGRWRVRLPPLEPGGPFELALEAAGERLVLRDVLVGDVWLCSGQSNMEWSVADAMNAAEEIAAARDPGVRHLKVPRSWAAEPSPELAGGAWEPADPEHAGGFTAVGWFFARDLRRHLDVPIGLLNSTWGGSRIEPWMSARALDLDGAAIARLELQELMYERLVLERIEARAGGLPVHDAGLEGGRAVWADPALDESGWQPIAVPARWEEAGWEGMDGVAWYRTAFELSAAEAQAGISLGLGTIDDSDVAWVNGREVGRTERAWNRPRVYEAPAAALVAGRNVVAVRVEDTGGGGGIWGDPALLYVETAGGRRPLAGSWRFRPGAVTVNLDEHKNQVPTMLYNRMIHPLQEFPIAGVLWYQGESNADSRGDAITYRGLFEAMIADWRRGWGAGELPFLWVQLAAYRQPPAEPGDSDWALLRESQSAALGLPRTAQVVILDAGDADDVHPRNKQVVGERLALAARRVAYGEDLVHSGPVYRRHEIRDGRVVIEFDHAEGGLVAGRTTPGTLDGFALAGADRRFVRADAAIEGDRVVVRSERVPEPVAVRYGWADNPEGANLYNLAGLPASPFRTDPW